MNDEIEKGWIENKEFPQNCSEKETNVTLQTETTTYAGNNNEFDKIQHISHHQLGLFRLPVISVHLTVHCLSLIYGLILLEFYETPTERHSSSKYPQLDVISVKQNLSPIVIQFVFVQ